MTENLNKAKDLLRSEVYGNVLKTQNLPTEMLQQSLEIINRDDLLLARAEKLSLKAQQSLLTFYGDAGDIIVPFSGGYDSSLIATRTIQLLGSSRNIWLITVVSGMMQRGSENPGNQAQRIANIIQRPVNHRFLDLHQMFGENVIVPAIADSQQLGFPSICSTCKISMELALAEAAVSLGAKHIAWGYNLYQAKLLWTEQHPAQRKAMNEFIRQKFPDLNSGSPLYRVVKLPLDPILLIASMGFPPQNANGEGRCFAAGLNPQRIDDERLYNFVVGKLVKLSGKARGGLYEARQNVLPYGAEIDALRKSELFRQGVFDEKEQIEARDAAFK